LDVEPELVQPAQARLEPAALADSEYLLACELVPELVVTRAHRCGELERIVHDVVAELRGEIVELACEVLLGDVEIVLALALGEPIVQLTGLCVDEVRRQAPGVATEERVRERAVAPEESGEVQAYKQLRERGDDRRRRRRQ